MLQILFLGSPFIIFLKIVSTLTLTFQARDQLTYDECLLQTSVGFFFLMKNFSSKQNQHDIVCKEGLVYMCRSG